jgi:hypothetical protein
MPSKTMLMLTLLFILTAGMIFAETADLNYGVKAGFNLAQHYAPNMKEDVYKVNTGMRPGIMAGAWLDMEILPHLALGYELLYTQKGSNESISVLKIEEGEGNWVDLEKPAQMHVKYQLDYLELPILLKIKTFERGRFSMTALTGTAFSYKVHSHHELDGTVYFYEGEDSLGVPEYSEIPISQQSGLKYVNSFDYSFVYGTALSYSGKVKLTAEFRFTLGWDYLQLPTFSMSDVEMEPVELRNQTYSLIIVCEF